MKKQYPQELFREDYFKCPVWYADEPSFVNSLNKASDPYIEISKKKLNKAVPSILKPSYLLISSNSFLVSFIFFI